MLVHFIGGPAHGRAEAIQDPHPTYIIAALRSSAIFRAFDVEDVEDARPPAATVPFEEAHYKVTRRTPRYAIAEWQAPPVHVRFSVRLELDPHDHAAIDAFRQFFMERRTEAKHGVRCVGASTASGIESELELVTWVEGPQDAVALELAAKQVQHYLDAELPPCRRYVSAAEAATA